MNDGSRRPDDDAAFLVAGGWGLLIVGIIFGIGAWFVNGTYFEPWALIVFAGGLVLLTVGRARARRRP